MIHERIMENWFINRDLDRIMKDIDQIFGNVPMWDRIWVAGYLLSKTGKGGITKAETAMSLVKIRGNPDPLQSDINNG
jgi:hypothetical protein